jgi:hypothetical protein
VRCIIGALELERGMTEVRGRLSDGSTGRGGAMGSQLQVFCFWRIGPTLSVNKWAFTWLG